MDNLDIDNIWSSGHKKSTTPPTSVEETAKNHRGKSLQLVEKIRKTARGEHRIFLALATLGGIYLMREQFYYYLLGLVIYTVLIIWKYSVEMKMIQKIKFQDNTFSYLSAIRALLNKFMKIYQTGILFLLPSVVFVSALILESQQGNSIIQMLSDSDFWIMFVVASVLSIFVSKLFVKAWIHTFYGKKLREMEDMISLLS